MLESQNVRALKGKQMIVYKHTQSPGPSLETQPE